jgi:hypothetical protein
VPSQWYEKRKAARRRVEAADDLIEDWVQRAADDEHVEMPPMEPTSEVLTAAITVSAEWLAAMLCYAEGEGVKRMRKLQLRQETAREEAKEAKQDLRATLGLGEREVIPPEDNAEKDATLDPIPGVKLYRVVSNGETVAGGMTWVGARSERADRYRNDPSGHYTILADASETASHDQSTLGQEALEEPIPGQEAYAVVRMADWHPVARGIRWEQARKEKDRRGGMPKYGIVVDSKGVKPW